MTRKGGFVISAIKLNDDGLCAACVCAAAEVAAEDAEKAVTIRYEVNRTRPVVKEKTFASEAAMQRWVEKQEEAGRVLSVLAYSYGR